MTVMFEPYFGIPQTVVRDGKIKDLSGVAVKLYIALCHDSERYQTRELIRSSTQLNKLVGGSRNSYAKARLELVNAGLVEAESYGTEGFVFHLCNPETGRPWPIPPNERVHYKKKGDASSVTSQRDSILSKPGKPPKISEAGTSFPHGSNLNAQSPTAAANSQMGTIQMPRWDDCG